MDRVEEIRRRLSAAFTPRELAIRDDGHQHVGHAGARDGRGHFHVRIVSQAFAGKSPLARQRMVYAVLGDLMQTDIHALAMDVRTEEEA